MFRNKEFNIKKLRIDLTCLGSKGQQFFGLTVSFMNNVVFYYNDKAYKGIEFSLSFSFFIMFNIDVKYRLEKIKNCEKLYIAEGKK